MRFLIQHALDLSAAKTPDSTVFRYNGDELTYSECVTRTNQLANSLIAQGVERGDRVGIYLHKSLESAIAIYGILKAGAIYVPIDPRLPPMTVTHLLSQCGIRHLVSEGSKATSLDDIAVDVPLDSVIGITKDEHELRFSTLSWQDVSEAPSSAPDIPMIESDLAYIMYTSGSTGKPKGIMHTHRSGLSYAQRSMEVYGVVPGDILANHSPLHFDMSTFDYFTGPLAGATTVIIPEPYMLLPASLSELIEDEGITIWYSVSNALVDLLVRGDIENRDLGKLRLVNFGGEPFPPNHLRDLMARLPGARFCNVYGPAEVNQCTFFNVPDLPNQFADRFVPIGRVWDIADSLIVDPEDNEVAQGEQGELLVASSTCMRGYWQDPDRTKAAFFIQQSSEGASVQRRYYRTGDIVRSDEQGRLDFLGRKDRQVKVRGFRVELDGIEAVLTSHESAAESAAWIVDATPPSIHAAILIKETYLSEVTASALMQFLSANLPSYAVPSRIAIRNAFPRTGSGKIDRRALKELDMTEASQVDR